MIPKPNGKKRPLGIPCLRDKIVQEAMRMALEPIFEVEFHDNSYGFRPHRNTHHAVFRCQQLTRSGFSWVVEGDVKACFDEISHKSILKVLREKVMDNKFLDLVCRFLKAGVNVEGVVQPTEKGVPQGGVISPLLANAVLNKLDWFLHNKGKHGSAGIYTAAKQQPNVRFVRYADDWCVFITRASKQYAETLRDQIQEFLYHECDLELSMEKTHVTHIRDGIEFLGFRIASEVGQSGNLVPKIKISSDSKRNLRQRLEDAMHRRPHQESIALRITRGSAVVRGWSEYYRIACDFTDKAATFDHWAFWIAVKAICRKLDIPTGKCMKMYYRNTTIYVDKYCQLEMFSGKKMKLDYRGPEPYIPGNGIYETDEQMEADFSLCREKLRPGSDDLKYQALKRDDYKCQKCGKPVTDRTSHADHIVPVKCFASFALASTLENIQTLCLSCHGGKHYAK
jgi:group II intron reverse transcriptase/maturase